uniref:Peroxidase n=1 Tax=Acrobeloides nanus TaxID=290746 RepID=A0A914CGT1_9BILA
MEDCEESFGECQAIKDDFAEILDDDVEHVKARTANFKSRFGPYDKEINLAIHDVQTIYNGTEKFLSESMTPLDRMREPGRFWVGHTLSSPSAREKAFPAFAALLATKRLYRKHENIPEEEHKILKEYCSKDNHRLCENLKYRRVDGLCNNVKNPNWGANYAPFQRFIPADYGDEVEEFRRAHDGSELPNVRLITQLLIHEPVIKINMVTAMTSHWSHFVYTDLVHIGSSQLTIDGQQFPIPCCERESPVHPECAPIKLPSDDPLYGGFVSCMSYSRTVPAPKENCALGSREQANQATSYLDGSTIYGSNVERFRVLRTLRDGKLKTSAEFDEGELPPTMDILTTIFSGGCASSSVKSCFLSGSEHINFLPTTAAIHILWIRQHNKIAQKLLTLNPKWTDKQLFQEARRIVIAQIQHITYNEWLPIVVGKESWMRYNLNPLTTGYSNAYSMNIDASVLNSFAAIVGQFFYTMFDGHLAQYSSQGVRILDKPVNEYLNDPGSLFFSERVSGVLRDKLFKNNGNMGLDLPALILQTGRDHGIPSYTVWREKCGGGKITSFKELEDDIIDSDQILPILARLFKSVTDVDLFILGLAEKPVRGALVGPTFGCILSLQFQKTKRGDRYWYENPFSPAAFTEEQLGEIKKTTLAKIICDNSEIRSIQPKVLEMPDLYDNFPIACNSSFLPSIDLNLWQDELPQVQMPVTMATIRKAIHLGMLEVEERRKRETHNIRRNQREFSPGEPLYSYGKMMRIKREASEISRMSEI